MMLCTFYLHVHFMTMYWQQVEEEGAKKQNAL